LNIFLAFSELVPSGQRGSFPGGFFPGAFIKSPANIAEIIWNVGKPGRARLLDDEADGEDGRDRKDRKNRK
jgi:hypothetical protein